MIKKWFWTFVVSHRLPKLILPWTALTIPLLLTIFLSLILSSFPSPNWDLWTFEETGTLVSEQLEIKYFIIILGLLQFWATKKDLMLLVDIQYFLCWCYQTFKKESSIENNIYLDATSFKNVPKTSILSTKTIKKSPGKGVCFNLQH